MNHIVEISKFDASRPFAVIRKFNYRGRVYSKCVNRYATKEQAVRRANDLNKAN